MIGADVYYIFCHLKGSQVFTLSMKDIQNEVEKEPRANVNSKIVLSHKYHNFYDNFSKKNSNNLFLYQKYDYKVYLEEE